MATTAEIKATMQSPGWGVFLDYVRYLGRLEVNAIMNMNATDNPGDVTFRQGSVIAYLQITNSNLLDHIEAYLDNKDKSCGCCMCKCGRGER